MVLFLLITMALGFVFLGIKTIEYKEKFDHHLVPGPHFHTSARPASPATRSRRRSSSRSISS